MTSNGSPAGEDRWTSYLGMVVAVASWGMLFAALLLSYVLLRVQQPVWPPLGSPPLPLGLAVANTAVLLLSSVVLSWGGRKLGRGGREEFHVALQWTIALGIVFLGLQLRLWQATHANGLGLTHIFGGMFYVLTWAHAAHIVAGLGALLWLVPGSRQRTYGPERRARVMMVSLFWHFLDVVWVVMFVAIFVV